MMPASDPVNRIALLGRTWLNVYIIGRAHPIEPTKDGRSSLLELLKWMLALIDFIKPSVNNPQRVSSHYPLFVDTEP